MKKNAREEERTCCMSDTGAEEKVANIARLGRIVGAHFRPTRLRGYAAKYNAKNGME